MRKVILSGVILSLVACGGESSVNTEEDGNDTIENGLVEFELDEDRMSAADFNNELMQFMNSAIEAINSVFAAEGPDVDINHQNALFELDILISKCRELDSGGADGDKFKSSVMDLLEFYHNECNGGMAEVMVPLQKKDHLSKEDQKKLQDYDDYFAAEEVRLVDSIVRYQETFAALNNIELVDQ